MNTITTQVVKSIATSAAHAASPALKAVAPSFKRAGKTAGTYLVGFAACGVLASIGPRVMVTTFAATEAALKGSKKGLSIAYNGVKFGSLAVASAPKKLFSSTVAESDNVIHLTDQSLHEATAA